MAWLFYYCIVALNFACHLVLGTDQIYNVCKPVDQSHVLDYGTVYGTKSADQSVDHCTFTVQLAQPQTHIELTIIRFDLEAPQKDNKCFSWLQIVASPNGTGTPAETTLFRACGHLETGLKFLFPVDRLSFRYRAYDADQSQGFQITFNGAGCPVYWDHIYPYWANGGHSAELKPADSSVIPSMMEIAKETANAMVFRCQSPTPKDVGQQWGGLRYFAPTEFDGYKVCNITTRSWQGNVGYCAPFHIDLTEVDFGQLVDTSAPAAVTIPPTLPAHMSPEEALLNSTVGHRCLGAFIALYGNRSDHSVVWTFWRIGSDNHELVAASLSCVANEPSADVNKMIEMRDRTLLIASDNVFEHMCGQQTNFTWFPSLLRVLPTCIVPDASARRVECRRVPSIQYGYVKTLDLDTIEYDCMPHFRLEGDSRFMCNTASPTGNGYGVWRSTSNNTQFPRCILDVCSWPSHAATVRYERVAGPEEVLVVWSCVLPNVQVGGDVVQACGWRGVWSGTPLRCAVLAPIMSLAQDHVAPTYVHHGSNWTYILAALGACGLCLAIALFVIWCRWRLLSRPAAAAASVSYSPLKSLIGGAEVSASRQCLLVDGPADERGREMVVMHRPEGLNPTPIAVHS